MIGLYILLGGIVFIAGTVTLLDGIAYRRRQEYSLASERDTRRRVLDFDGPAEDGSVTLNLSEALN